jgi:hypothetical protein
MIRRPDFSRLSQVANPASSVQAPKVEQSRTERLARMDEKLLSDDLMRDIAAKADRESKGQDDHIWRPGRLRVKAALGTPPFAALGFWRLLVLLAAFGLFVLLLIGRLTTLALFESSRAYGATNTEYVPDRGDIVDRNGVPLARSIYGYAIWVKPDQLLGNKKELANQLAVIFPDTSPAEFYRKLIDDKPGYLRKRALPEQVRRVHDLGEIAIEFPREATRLYPQHDMAAHVLGFCRQS